MSIQLFPRILQSTILQDFQDYPVVALMGARQTGKSTLGKIIARKLGMAVRTLDDRDVLRQATDDPEGFLAQLGSHGNGGMRGAGAFIDEAQRAPQLFLTIKAVVDRDQRPSQYLLSGSNQPNIASGVGDSLLGRAAYRTLRPLTLSEQRLSDTHRGWELLFEENTSAVLQELERRAGDSGVLDWRSTVATGGFPRVMGAAELRRKRLLNDYVEVFANRDIRELLAVESAERFEQFLRLVAARTGQVFNASALSVELGVAVNTVRRWADALKRSYLLELVPAYHRNAGQRITKAPKLFMADSAFAMVAAREAQPSGFHLENLVVTDLMVWRDAHPGRTVNHWRTQSGEEVDFVIEQNQRAVPVEVKTTSAVGPSDTRHLKAFLDKYPAVRGVILTSDCTIREIGNRIIAAPWWAVL